MQKLTIKAALASLGVLGLAASHPASAALTQAQTGNGSVIVVATDPAGDSFYADTGELVSQIFPGTSTSFSMDFSSSANFQSFLTAAGSTQITYGLIAGGNESTGGTTPNGAAYDYASTTDVPLSGAVTNANLKNWSLIDGNFIQIVNSSNVEGSDNTWFVPGGSTGGIPQYVSSGQFNWYGHLNGTFDSNLNNIGTTANVYFFTGSGTLHNSTDSLTGSALLSGDMFTFTGQAAVPLPPAVWLLGGGLLGLMGIARRRTA